MLDFFFLRNNDVWLRYIESSGIIAFELSPASEPPQPLVIDETCGVPKEEQTNKHFSGNNVRQVWLPQPLGLDALCGVP